jgi:hypothetical protein
MSNSIVVGATQGMTKGFGFSVRKIITLITFGLLCNPGRG